MANYNDTATVSGSVVSISDGADEVGTKSCVVTIPASLSGVSAVTETQIPSRNMASMSDADFILNGVRYKTENGILYINGTSTGETSSGNDAFKVLDFWLPSGTYYFSRGATLTSLNVATYLRKYDDKTEIKANQGSFTLSENTHLYVSFYVYNKTFSNIKAEICINIGSTAITYEDTAPMTQYTASLGRTIHGGEVDIVNGVGTDENGNDFTFTGQEVPTRLGYNAFWSEQGNTELTYYKDGYGFTSVTVNRCGKNFLDDTLLNLEQGSINGSTGANENANNRVRNASAIPFPYDEIVSSYTWTIPSGYKVAIRPYDANGNFVQLPSWALAFITQLPQNLIGQGITQMRFVLAKTDNSAITPSEMANIGFQIELGSQASSYEPYEAVTKTAKFHRIIYGGTADVIRGTCEPKNLAEFSNADNANRDSFSYTTEKPELIEWTKTGSGGKFYARFILHIPKPGKYTISCTNDSTVKAKYIYSDELWGTSVYSSVSTNPFVAEFSESGDYVMGFYAGSGATSGTLGEVMCEEGETQTSYAPYFAPFSFPPISMETDEGENTLFANEGASAITYRKETD